MGDGLSSAIRMKDHVGESARCGLACSRWGSIYHRWLLTGADGDGRGSPSLWYFLCYCALPIIGIVWLWRPPLAAALSVGPLISVVALLPYALGMWVDSRSWAGAVIAGLTAAVVLVVAAVRGFPKWRLPVVLSLTFVTCAFATDRLFTNKAAIRTYQAFVALDGKGPSSIVGPSEGPEDVVLYRTGRNGVICYDVFHSKELHDYLLARNGQMVTAEYDTFSDFGKVRGFNVHSVDGKVLANGYHVLRKDFASGAGVAREGPGSARGSDCW